MDYQVYTPSAELQPFVKCFWTLEDDGSARPVRQRIVPDGCMEMIFHYRDPYRQYFEDGSSIIQPRCFIFGQITKYIEIEPTGASGLISARFLPAGLAPFLQVPVAELQDKAVKLADLFGIKSSQPEKEIMAATNNIERIKHIETFLLSLLAEPRIADAVTKNCVDAIIQSRGQMGVVELAGKVNVNRRNIERRFTSVVGMSPKQLSRAVRLQAALKMLGEKNFTSLTSLAYENGYYDQAHFIKDFKEFTGMSPKSFFAGNLRFAALFVSAE